MPRRRSLFRVSADRTMPSGQLQGEDLFESVTGAALARKEQRCANRCDYCWHDRAQRCMCHSARPHSLHTTVNFKLLVLMHSKEYLNPGTDAKLLLAMLPPERAKLYARLPPSNPARGARASSARATPTHATPCALHRSCRCTGGPATWRRCARSSTSRRSTRCCCGPARAR